MVWDDGREKLDEVIEHNKRCEPDDVIYECGEWFSSDGVTWSNVDNKGNLMTYNPDGEDIFVDSIYDEFDLESIDKWYAEHFEELVEKYGGRAIAVVDENVVANEDSEEKAYDIARCNYPKKVPFVTYIPKKDEFECCL